MVSSLDEIKKYNILFLLYPSGSSGEFLAYALSNTIDSMAQPAATWEDNSRMKFSDCLGRSLNATPYYPPESLVVSRFNLHLNHTDTSNNRISMALVHPNKLGPAYLQEHFSDAPVLEITTCDRVSQQFRNLASWTKIGIKIHNAFQHTDANVSFGKHLKINWSDIMLKCPIKEYQRVLDFLNVTGNPEKFLELVTDYLERNQDLVAQANES